VRRAITRRAMEFRRIEHARGVNGGVRGVGEPSTCCRWMRVARRSR